MCRYLKVSCSGYYSFCARKTSQRQLAREHLTQAVKDEFEANKRVYGSPRIHIELIKKNIRCSRPLVAKLMKEQALKSKLAPKFTQTTDSNHSFLIVENLLDRTFNPSAPSMVWVSDITFIPTLEGWCFLTIVMDLFDRKIIGWATSKSMKAEHTSIKAMKMALSHRKPTPGLIIHSDRGSQYACKAFKELIEPFTQSMSRKGNCWDNAVAESFFKSLKYEWINDYRFTTIAQASLTVFEYIEAWYNSKRTHSSLNYHSPNSFMEFYLKHNQVAA
jgi:transposase InsO family protein